MSVVGVAEADVRTLGLSQEEVEPDVLVGVADDLAEGPRRRKRDRHEIGRCDLLDELGRMTESPSSGRRRPWSSRRRAGSSCRSSDRSRSSAGRGGFSTKYSSRAGPSPRPSRGRRRSSAWASGGWRRRPGPG